MRQIELPEGWMNDLEAYAISALRVNANNVLDRNIMRAVCLGCGEWASLVLDGFGSDGRIHLICLNCCANLDIRQDNRIRLSDSGYAGSGYCDAIKRHLSSIGIDWRTGQEPKHHLASIVHCSVTGILRSEILLACSLTRGKGVCGRDLK